MNTKHNTAENSNSQETALPAGGISGKRLTVVVLVALIGTGLLLTYTLSVYSQLDLARKRADAQWREVATMLDARYRQAELAVAKGVDSHAVKMEFGEKFRLAVDGFRTTTSSASQQHSSELLEQLLAAEAEALGAVGVASELAQGIEAYNSHSSQIAKILASPGGRILDVFLGLPAPQPFRLP
jgi:hypothetical protein